MTDPIDVLANALKELSLRFKSIDSKLDKLINKTDNLEKRVSIIEAVSLPQYRQIRYLHIENFDLFGKLSKHIVDYNNYQQTRGVSFKPSIILGTVTSNHTTYDIRYNRKLSDEWIEYWEGKIKYIFDKLEIQKYDDKDIYYISSWGRIGRITNFPERLSRLPEQDINNVYEILQEIDNFVALE